MVQITTTSTESSKNRTDLVWVKGQSKEDGRFWLELVHRSWCYKAGRCRSWPWALSRQWTVHAPSYQHCRSCFFHLWRLKSVRRILGAEVTSGLVSAFVTTRLDYCNTVLAGLPQSTIDPLQRVQNAAARLVAGTGTRDHITPVLQSLHWLPISSALSTSSVCSCTWCEWVAALRTCRTWWRPSLTCLVVRDWDPPAASDMNFHGWN